MSVILQRRHAALFEGIFRHRSVAPNASVWDGTGRQFGPAVERMQQLLRDLDVRVACDCKEPADHVALELVALAQALRQGRTQSIQALLSEMQGWTAGFAPALIRADGNGFYGQAAQLLTALLEKIALKPSPQLPGVMDSLYSESRIRYPMVRRAWLEKGPGADPDGRGKGDFVRVSWDKAIELVAGELVQVRKTYGQQAVFAGSYGWKSPGKLHNCQTLLRRMLNLTGSFTNSAGDCLTGAAQVILPYVSGSIEVYEQCTTWKNLAENCQLMVLWGCNPINNSQISWQIADHGAWPGIEMVKKAGTKVLSIDPLRTETCEALNGEWLAPRPHTDVAMMLGIAHTLYVEGLHNQKFLNRFTTGFDKFLPYLQGTSDGTPKTADWAANICGISADTLRDLARRFAKNRTMLALGYSTQRQQFGEQVHWMLITLASMLWQIGLPGGGYGLSYRYSSGGAPTHTTPILKAIDDASGQSQAQAV
ncbi:molybdopterin-dependent oxidoreductase [Rhodoferax antarcticus]|uniref:Trimethylamine N-oxide reductase I catalytic subunit n=1 Tax=Rhodoferax antarcticus ANT.BR TaxID=1111071 RepID=A0A1Q8YD76_9BURK|nr:trimethylamine N-oxide reductase I catalytic subunit [Rhodoferax antarcticus ANT.BR]